MVDARLVDKIKSEALDRDRRREKKPKNGKTPFGSTPEEKRVVDLIKELRSMGCTWASIADSLQANNVPTRSGKPWCMANLVQLYKRIEVTEALHGRR